MLYSHNSRGFLRQCQGCESHIQMRRSRESPQKNISGKRIKAARLKCRPPVSQEDLAGRLAAKGVMLDQAAISRVENQTRCLMDFELVAIAKVLRVSVASLVGS